MSDETKKEIISIYLKYPFLVPCSDYRKWEGVMYTGENRHHLLINTPKYPSLRDSSVFCSHLNESDNHLQGINEEDTLINLLGTIESLLTVSDSPQKSLVKETYDIEWLKSLAQIVNDVENSIGRENVDLVCEKMSWIKLKYTDSMEYDNFIRISLDKRYPEEQLRILDVDLPEEGLAQFGQMRRLGDLYSCFKETVESLLPFWQVMSDLSTDAWIIEPLEPTRKDVHRRIFLSDNLSVQLIFNPVNISSMPDLKFLGSLGAVSQARDTYQRNLQNSGWWSESSVVDNLCRLLNLESLPKKTICGTNHDSGSSINKEDSNECSICYETCIENETLPSKWCNNKNCSGRFHHACLMEWMNSVPTSKTSFDHVSGPCPHCDEKIFCPIKLQ